MVPSADITALIAYLSRNDCHHSLSAHRRSSMSWPICSRPPHSKVQEAMIDSKLEDFARTQVREVLGSKNTVKRVEVLRTAPEQSVLRLTLSRPPHRLVLKVAGPGTGQLNFHRTATALSFARAAGVPVPTVLAVDTS